MLSGVRDDDPIFAAVREPLSLLRREARRGDVAELDRLLSPLAHVRFERQERKRRRREPFDGRASYDGSIDTRGVVPTREGSLHDWMNALAWAAFPRAKRAIHARQFAALSQEVLDGQTALPGRRSRLRDRLAMLDEGGVVLAVEGPEPTRIDGPAGVAWVLGHAILEHAAQRDAAQVRAAIVVVRAGPSLADADRALEAVLKETPDDALSEWLGQWPSIEVGRLVR